MMESVQNLNDLNTGYRLVDDYYQGLTSCEMNGYLNTHRMTDIISRAFPQFDVSIYESNDVDLFKLENSDKTTIQNNSELRALIKECGGSRKPLFTVSQNEIHEFNEFEEYYFVRTLAVPLGKMNSENYLTLVLDSDSGDDVSLDELNQLKLFCAPINMMLKKKKNSETPILSVDSENDYSQNLPSLASVGLVVGKWCYDSRSGMITCSPEVYSIIEYQKVRDEVPPQFFIPFILELKLSELKKMFVKADTIACGITEVLKYRTLTGKVNYASINAKKIITGDDEFQIVGSVQDITKFKKIEFALEENQERHKKILENIQTGVVITNNSHHFSMANKKFLEMSGYTEAEILNYNIIDLAPMEHSNALKQQFKKLVKGEINEFTIEHQLKRKDGSHLSVLTISFGIYDENGIFIEAISSILDITHRVESNKHIMESIIETENLERTRISTTLHDSIGQNLTSVHLILNSLKNSKNLNSTDTAYVDKLIDIVLKTITELREISHNLFPKHISRFGLIASVKNLIEDINNTSGITKFKLFTNFEDKLLSINVQLAVYRIIQEAVNNILKYSKATKVDIQMIKHSSIILVLIEDNGIGFDFNEKLNEGKSLGLRSMQNRAKSISANLTIESAENRGTTISIQLNL